MNSGKEIERLLFLRRAKSAWFYPWIFLSCLVFLPVKPVYAGSSKSAIVGGQSESSSRQSFHKLDKNYRKIVTFALSGKDSSALQLCKQFLSDFQAIVQAKEVDLVESLEPKAIDLLEDPLAAIEKKQQEVCAIAACIENRQGNFAQAIEYFSQVYHQDLATLHLHQAIQAAVRIQEEGDPLASKKAWYQIMLLSQRLFSCEDKEKQVLGRYGLLMARLSSECEMSSSCPLPEDYDSGQPCSLTISTRRALIGDLISHISSRIYSKDHFLSDLQSCVSSLNDSPSMRMAWGHLKEESMERYISDALHNFYDFRVLSHLVQETGRLCRGDHPGEFPIHDVFVWSFIEQSSRFQEGKIEAGDQLIQLLQHTQEPSLQALILQALFLSKVPSLTAEDPFSDLNWKKQDTSHFVDLKQITLMQGYLGSLSSSASQRALAALISFVKTIEAAQEVHQDQDFLQQSRLFSEKALEQIMVISEPLSFMLSHQRYEALTKLVEIQGAKEEVAASRLDPYVMQLAHEFSGSAALQHALALQAQLFLKERNTQKALDNFQYLVALAPDTEITCVYQAYCGLLCHQMDQSQQAWGYLDKAFKGGSFEKIASEDPKQYNSLYREAWRSFLEVNYALMDDPTSKQFAKKRLKACFVQFFDEKLISAEDRALWLIFSPLQELSGLIDNPGGLQIALQRQLRWRAAFLEHDKADLVQSSVYRGYTAVIRLLDPFAGDTWQKQAQDPESFFLALSYHWSAVKEINDEPSLQGDLNWIGDLSQCSLSKSDKELFLSYLESLLNRWQEYAPLRDELSYARLRLDEGSVFSSPFEDSHLSSLQVSEYRTLLSRFATRLQSQVELGGERSGLVIPQQIDTILMDPIVSPSWDLALPPVEEGFLLDRIVFLCEKLAREDEWSLTQLTHDQDRRLAENRLVANRFLSGRVQMYRGDFVAAQKLFLQLRSQQLESLKNHANFIAEEEVLSTTLYLAFSQQLAGDKSHEAFETFQKLLTQLRSGDEPSSWAGLQLHTARVGIHSIVPYPLWRVLEENPSIASSPKASQILELYESLVEVRQLETEPLHLEAAIEAAFLRSITSDNRLGTLLSSLREVRKLFSQELDVQSQEYYQKLQMDEQKSALHETYLLLLDAMIVQLELISQDAGAHLKSLDQNRALHQLARSLYRSILAEDTPSTAFLQQYAQYWLQHLEEISFSQPSSIKNKVL